MGRNKLFTCTLAFSGRRDPRPTIVGYLNQEGSTTTTTTTRREIYQGNTTSGRFFHDAPDLDASGKKRALKLGNGQTECCGLLL